MDNLSETMLFELIDGLEKATNSIFDEIVSMNNETLYKYTDVSDRLTELFHLYNKVAKLYEYYSTKEESKYYDATRRFQLKKALTILTTVYAFLANPLLGIGSFVLLNMKATKDYTNELESIDEYVEKYDDKRIVRVGNVLENSRRIFNNKLDNTHNIKINKKNALIIVANKCIKLYIDQEVDINFLNGATDELKECIIHVLQISLNTDNNDIYELLDMAKNEHSKSIVLKKTR